MLKHSIIAHYIALDLTEFEADKKLFEETVRHGYEVEWLINNAGFGSMGDFAELDLEHELQMIDLNISALVALTHRYLFTREGWLGRGEPLPMGYHGDARKTAEVFRMIDGEKLSEMRGDVLRTWNQNGLLALIYAHVDGYNSIRQRWTIGNRNRLPI